MSVTPQQTRDAFVPLCLPEKRDWAGIAARPKDVIANSGAAKFMAV
jgi:hypothetical protein